MQHASRSLVRLLPGEKHKLRREAIRAKRAARAARKGFDLESVRVELEDMVVSKCEMKTFPPVSVRIERRSLATDSLYADTIYAKNGSVAALSWLSTHLSTPRLADGKRRAAGRSESVHALWAPRGAHGKWERGPRRGGLPPSWLRCPHGACGRAARAAAEAANGERGRGGPRGGHRGRGGCWVRGHRGRGGC